MGPMTIWYIPWISPSTMHAFPPSQHSFMGFMQSLVLFAIFILAVPPLFWRQEDPRRENKRQVLMTLVFALGVVLFALMLFDL